MKPKQVGNVKGIPVQKSFDIIRAERAVIKAAKRFHKTYIGSTHCDCPDDALYNAIDALIELEKQK